MVTTITHLAGCGKNGGDNIRRVAVGAADASGQLRAAHFNAVHMNERLDIDTENLLNFRSLSLEAIQRKCHSDKSIHRPPCLIDKYCYCIMVIANH